MGSSCNLLVCLEQGPPLELCKRPGVQKLGPSCPVFPRLLDKQLTRCRVVENAIKMNERSTDT